MFILCKRNLRRGLFFMDMANLVKHSLSVTTDSNAVFPEAKRAANKLRAQDRTRT